MIPDEKILEFQKELSNSIRPIFFFDDDCDGLSAFLLLYRKIQGGKGVPIKAAPTLNEQFLPYIYNYSPDKVFVLDNTRMNEEFIKGAKSKILALDHHPYEKYEGVRYFNPLDYDKDNNWPTTYWAKKIADNPNDLWIAMAGCIGDWHLPDFKDEFIEKYPDLMSKDITKPDDALFDSEIGRLAQLFYFLLKGTTKTVLANIKTLTRIDSPYEILYQQTPGGKFLWKHYSKIRKQYDSLLNDAKKSVTENNFIVFTYEDNKTSMTAEVSNELIHMHPDKVVIVGRHKDGEFRCSLRSAQKPIAPALEKVLQSVEGYGGGHQNACGCSIKEHDFGRFLELLEEEYLDE